MINMGLGAKLRGVWKKLHIILCVIMLLRIVALLDKNVALSNANQQALRISSLPQHEATFVIFKPTLTRAYKQAGMFKSWNLGGRQLEVIESRSNPSVYASWPTSAVFIEWISSGDNDSINLVCDPSCENPKQYYLLSPYQVAITHLQSDIKHTKQHIMMSSTLFVLALVTWLVI